MVLIGLDFGSHHSSLALWNEDTNSVEVFADDMGSRHIPCMVAFRKERDEVLVGSAAQVQKHKNSSNTFENIRQLLERENTRENDVYIPAREKSISVLELASHFFRHVSNQVKEQLGKSIKDCIIAISPHSTDILKTNLIEAARMGGLRIKSFLYDNLAALLAHRLDDDTQLQPQKSLAIVVDFGWSKCEISCYEIISGVFSPLSSVMSTSLGGAVLVDNLTKHSAKDFQRKAKFSCMDNNRAMMRLSSECESAVKVLSLSAEAAIDIDSLCEGVDYAGKISRVRLDDLCTVTFLSLKEMIQSAVNQAITAYSQQQPAFLAPINADDFTHIVLAGGFSSVPKVQSILSSLLPRAHVLRSRIDPSEAIAIGCCWHGATLHHEGILDSALDISLNPSQPLPCCAFTLLLEGSGNSMVAATAGTPLPFSRSIAMGRQSTETKLCLVIRCVSAESEGSIVLGRLVWTPPVPEKECEVSVKISISGEVEVSVRQQNQLIEKLVIGPQER